MVPVKDHASGVAGADDGTADAYASDRVILIGVGRTSKNPAKLSLIDEYFTYEPYGLMLRRGDSAFRLSVNRTLASVYRSGEIVPIYQKWFESDDDRSSARPPLIDLKGTRSFRLNTTFEGPIGPFDSCQPCAPGDPIRLDSFASGLGRARKRDAARQDLRSDWRPWSKVTRA